MQNPLGLERIGKVGHGYLWFSAGEHGDDVSGLVNEAVLVTEAVAVGPPRRGIWVVIAAASDVDRGPTSGAPRSAGVVKVELVHTLEVESQRSVLTVYLKSVRVVIAGREAGGFERCNTSTR